MEVMLEIQKIGERILASLRSEWAAKAQAKKDAEEAQRRVWAAAREYRQLYGDTPCECRHCSSRCSMIYTNPECSNS